MISSIQGDRVNPTMTDGAGNPGDSSKERKRMTESATGGNSNGVPGSVRKYPAGPPQKADAERLDKPSEVEGSQIVN